MRLILHQMAQLRRQAIRLIHLICPLIRDGTVHILASDSLQVVLETRLAGQEGDTTANGTVCNNDMLILRPIVSLSQYFPMSTEFLLTHDIDDIVTLERPNYMPLLQSYRSENYLSKISRYDRTHLTQSGHPRL